MKEIREDYRSPYSEDRYSPQFSVAMNKTKATKQCGGY